MQALRNLRAGETLEVGLDIRLARLLRGFRAQLDEKIAQGPPGYSGTFPANRRVGQLLSNLAGEARRYVALVPECAPALGPLAASAHSAATSREYEWKDTVGYNDFNETVLEEVRSHIEAVIERLPEVQTVGGADEDAPVPFVVEDMAAHLEMLTATEDFASSASFAATLMLRVRSMMADARLAPIVGSGAEPTLESWLTDYVGGPAAENGRITVLDLSLVPADVLHLVIAVVSRVVFESLQRYRKLNDAELPTVLVLEEAHTFVQRYLGDEGPHATPARMCRETFERIAREGRKFGLGLVLSSQRPSELSETVLSQCNTFLLHRLVNDRDQQLVGRLVPDNLGGLLDELPSLPSQQAILLGWAAQVPTLVRLHDLPRSHRPKSEDPAFWDVWTGEADRPVDWTALADGWADS